VSKPADNGEAPEQAAFATLEGAVKQALGRLNELTTRADAAEGRSAELSELVQRFTGDEAEAGRMLTRLKRLEDENVDLRQRLERGRAGVERMIARIRFLENQA
jgi:predicted nuclease with TOPRIM domain